MKREAGENPERYQSLCVSAGFAAVDESQSLGNREGRGQGEGIGYESEDLL